MEFKIVNICFEYSSKEYQYLLESTDDVKIGATYKIPSGVNKYGTMFKYIKVKSIQTVNVLPSIVTSGVKLNSKNYMANTYRIADERLKTLRAVKPITMPTPTPVVVATPKPVEVQTPTIEQTTISQEVWDRINGYAEKYYTYRNKCYTRRMWRVSLPYGIVYKKNIKKLRQTISDLKIILKQYNRNRILVSNRNQILTLEDLNASDSWACTQN